MFGNIGSSTLDSGTEAVNTKDTMNRLKKYPRMDCSRRTKNLIGDRTVAYDCMWKSRMKQHKYSMKPHFLILQSRKKVSPEMIYAVKWAKGTSYLLKGIWEGSRWRVLRKVERNNCTRVYSSRRIDSYVRDWNIHARAYGDCWRVISKTKLHYTNRLKPKEARETWIERTNMTSIHSVKALAFIAGSAFCFFSSESALFNSFQDSFIWRLTYAVNILAGSCSSLLLFLQPLLERSIFG